MRPPRLQGNTSRMSTALVPNDEVRTRFSCAISDMYRQEVPLYGTLLEIVAEVNLGSKATTAIGDGPARLEIERHGAVRIGKASELAMLRRVFGVMGMFPVGYYDLAGAGIPVHSTAFRPIARESLERNPFRMFTSLLRLELIADPELRDQARCLLDRREIFPERLVRLVETSEKQGGLDDGGANAFVEDVVDVFRWHGDISVPAETYRALNSTHRLIADVVCFRGPHINHLTPRTVDIDAVQQTMLDRGIDAKDVIEGPPRRRVPILLRQTSFKAMHEPLRFIVGDEVVTGVHSARFGEVEQRGMALTPKGRALYDELLREGRAAEKYPGAGAAFDRFPDDEQSIRVQGLGYFRYALTDRGESLDPAMRCGVPLQALVDDGYVVATALTYEDFLPVSAAGIFQSNLGDRGTEGYASRTAQDAFEHALGCPVMDPFAIYSRIEEASIREVLGQ